ncbi:MAG: hypothetical protein P1P86_00225 [Bacteroidales bacterium]|nr:hypothetical protein [Bacteroidales bacterium]
MKTKTYRVNGLNLSSEIELPELVSSNVQKPDVWIRFGSVPDHLPEAAGSGVLYEASKDDFLFKLNTVAKYRVQNGKYITIEPLETTDQKEIRLFLFASTMGALLHQRGMLAIHGSCVAKENKGIIFTGISSAGKSTIAAGFYIKGYSVITDDIAVIDNSEKKHFIHPGIPHLKLWQDVVYYMNEESNLERVRSELEKYRKPIPALKPSIHVPLEKIILLTTKNTPGFHFEEVFGADKFQILRQNTYRVQFLEMLNQLEIHFKNISSLASSIPLYKVERPSSPLQVMELTDYIEKHILHI